MFLSFHALFGEIITKSLPDKIHGTQVGAQVVGVKHDKETQASGGGGGTAAAARPPRLSRAMLAAVAAAAGYRLCAAAVPGRALVCASFSPFLYLL